MAYFHGIFVTEVSDILGSTALTPVTLGPLALSGEIRVGVATSGTIGGALAGSTLAMAIPGITVDSLNRTYAGTPTGSPGTIANGVVETLVGAVNSPRSSAITLLPALPTVTLSADLSLAEGNSGAKLFTYTVTRSATAGAISVPWSFSAGGTSAADFTGGALPTGGTTALADGAASGSFTISVNGDADVETDELFTVSIAAPSGYVLGLRSSATGTIVNDDASNGTPTPTTLVSSVAFRNATFSFQSPAPVGYYFDNRPFVVGAAVTAVSPASETLAAGSWLFGQDEAATFQDSGDTVTKTGHGLVAGQKVRFSAITSTTGIATATDYFVVNPAANTFQLAATSGGAALALTTNGSGTFRRYGTTARTINGLMVNPGAGGTTGGNTGGVIDLQGFDSIDSVDAVLGSTHRDFSLALDSDPAITGAPLSGVKTLVKGVSVVATTLDGGKSLTDLAILPVVASAPPANSFPPHPSDLDPTPFFQTTDCDYGAWPTLAVPAGATVPTQAQVLEKIRIAQTFFTNNLFDQHISPSNQQEGYGGDIHANVMQAMLYLCVAGPSAADKKAVADILVSVGIDIWRRTVNGGRWPSLKASFGGGHAWIKPLLVFAAWALRNATKTASVASITDHANAASKNYFASDLMTIKVDRALIDTAPDQRYFPLGAPYADYMENSLDWNSFPSNAPSAGSGFNTRYRLINGNPTMGCILALRTLGVAESLWGNPDFFTYHDMLFQWWLQNGRPNDRLTSTGGLTFNKEMLTSYYAAASPALSSAAVPQVVRIVARNRHVWAEFDRPLDRSVYPALSAFAVTVDGAPVTLPASVSTTASWAANGAVINVTSAAGIVPGMRAIVPGFPLSTHVVSVSGTAITLDTSLATLGTGQAVSFHAVEAWGKSLAVTLPTALAAGQAVTLAYTQPGSSAAKSLGSGLVASIPATAATNLTGTLPAGATVKDAVAMGSPGDYTRRQFSGAPAPSGTARRWVMSARFILNSKTVNDTLISSFTSSTGTGRLYIATAANMRMIYPGGYINLPNATTNLPLNTPITMHLVADHTATTAAATFRTIFTWAGGSLAVDGTGSTGTFDGSYANNIGTMFSGGIFFGAGGSGGGGSNVPMDGALRELMLGWGDETYALPADFTGAGFAHNADWGGNGQNVWGGPRQRYYAGSVDEWNSSVPNRGSGIASAMTPRRIDATTDELVTRYVAAGV